MVKWDTLITSVAVSGGMLVKELCLGLPGISGGGPRSTTSLATVARTVPPAGDTVWVTPACAIA